MSKKKPFQKNETQEEELKEKIEENAVEDADDKSAANPGTDRVNELEQKNAEYLDRLQRTLAEFDNFRKRTEKEKTFMYNDGAADTIAKLLPIIDNFERAVTAYNSNGDDTFFKGVEMILKQMHETLASMDVLCIQAIGEQFDPNFHEAVMHIEDENFGENEIVEDIQRGYTFKERVLRPSMVKVAN